MSPQFKITPLSDNFEAPRKAPHNFPQIGAGKYIAGLFVGSMGTGKSTAMLNLLKAYDSTKSFDKVYYISRTAHLDVKVVSILEGLKAEYTIYDDTVDFEDILTEIKGINKDYVDFNLYKKAYQLFLNTPEELLHKIPEEQMILLENNSFSEPDYKLFPMGKPSHLIIMDDLLGSGLLSTNNRSPLNKFISTHRHHATSFILSLQAYSQSLSPALRSCLNLYCLWACKNLKIQQSMATALAGHIKPDAFIKMWDIATQGSKFDFLSVNLHAKDQFTKNLSIVLSSE